MQELCVLSVKTEAYQRGGVHHFGKSMRVLKRLTTYDILGETVDSIGAEEAYMSIINLSDIDDGLYQIVACNVSRDWETGAIDDWDFKLIPYGE